MRFIYVMDPMCAWCYGFQPQLELFLSKYPQAEVDWIMGGLAPDTEKPMANDLKQRISSYWYQIEARCQVTFNHQFWQLNTPYRSTYPACRAVLAAESISKNSADKVVKAIQSAYYIEAQNPSLDKVLMACAKSIGLDEKVFVTALKSLDIDQQLQQHLSITQQLKVQGFPALFYITDNSQVFPLTLGYTEAESIEQRFIEINSEIRDQRGRGPY